MYSPEKNHKNQYGGDYTSTAQFMSSSDYTSSILSSLLYFTNIYSFHINSFDQISQLPLDQFNILIDAVTQQFNTDTQLHTDIQKQFITSTLQISTILQYDHIVHDQLLNILVEYNNESTIQHNIHNKIYDTYSSLQYLNSIASLYESSIIGYQNEYSSFFYEMANNDIIIANEESTLNGLLLVCSTNVYECDYISTILKSHYISTLLNQSTINHSIAMYAKQYYIFSTIEVLTQFSVNIYSIALSYNYSSILGYTNVADTYNTIILNNIDILNIQTEQFYIQKQSQLNNELDNFKYAVNEWKSFIEYLTSELIIYRLELYRQIDSITFNFQHTLTQDQIDINIIRRSQLTILQSNIQDIINALTPLDIPFNSILTNINSEIIDKTIFINIRSTLTAYEIQVIQTSTLQFVPDFKTAYLQEIDNLNTCVLNIEPQIANRNKNYDTDISYILNVQLPLVFNLMIDDQPIFSHISQPDPIDTSIITFTSRKNEFILYSTINYDFDPILYNSVLGIP